MRAVPLGEELPKGSPPLYYIDQEGRTTYPTHNPHPQPGTIRLVVLGCTHGLHEQVVIPDGEALIHCGDVMCPRWHNYEESGENGWRSFCDEFLAPLAESGAFPRGRFITGGNHDHFAEQHSHAVKRLVTEAGGTFLIDEPAVIRAPPNDVLLFASPLSSYRGKGSNAFQARTGEDRFWKRDFEGPYVRDTLKKFPPRQSPVDILVTHGPPFGFGDSRNGTRRGGVEGSKELLEYVKELEPVYHLFADWHGDADEEYGHGIHNVCGDTWFVNTAVAQNDDTTAGRKSIARGVVVIDLPLDCLHPVKEAGAKEEWANRWLGWAAADRGLRRVSELLMEARRKGNNHRRSPFPGTMVVALTQLTLRRVAELSKEYRVSRKVDGVRYVLYGDRRSTPSGQKNDGTFLLMNRKMEAKSLTRLWIGDVELGQEWDGEVILDGELIESLEASTPTYIFMVFDVLYAGGRVLLELPLEERMGALSGVPLEGPGMWNVPEGHTALVKKEYFPMSSVEDLLYEQGWSSPYPDPRTGAAACATGGDDDGEDLHTHEDEINHLQDTLPLDGHPCRGVSKPPYSVDGLVFTPAIAPYIPGTDYNLLKWKPVTTCDFRFRKGQLWVTDEGREAPYGKARLLPEDELEVIEGSIVECERVTGDGDVWRVIRVRTDKPRPNHVSIVNSELTGHVEVEAVSRAFVGTEEEGGEGGSVAVVAAAYDRAATVTGLHVRQEYQNRMNDVKRRLILHGCKRVASPGSSVCVLDLACGRGGDVWKWAQVRTHPIEFWRGYDVAPIAVAEASRRASQAKLNGKASVADCFAEGFLAEPPGPYDIVSCMFALHYAFGSERQARSVIQNISRHLKKGGMFIGTLVRSEVICKLCNEALSCGSSVIGSKSSVYTVRDFGPMTEESYGMGYRFEIEGKVDAVEFVVPLGLFRQLLQDEGFEVATVEPFITSPTMSEEVRSLVKLYATFTAKKLI